MMSPEDRKLVDVFMEAQARPEGRIFSENVLAGCKAVWDAAIEAAAEFSDANSQHPFPSLLPTAIRSLKKGDK